MPADFTQDYLLDNERDAFQKEIWIKSPGGGEIEELVYVLIGPNNEIDESLEIRGIQGGQDTITSVPTAIPDIAGFPVNGIPVEYDPGLSAGILLTDPDGDPVWISTNATNFSTGPENPAVEHFGMNISLAHGTYAVSRETIQIRNDEQSDPEASDYLVTVYIVPQTIV